MKQPRDHDELIILIAFAILLTCTHSTAATTNFVDKLTTNRPLFDGETLISTGGVFALGFFSPNKSSNYKRYVGIWYQNISSHDVVWVANARSPVSGFTGSLTLAPNGTLQVIDRNTTVIWSSSPPPTSSTVTATNPTAQLHDTGNLIVTDGNSNYTWQSFDYPSNTAMSGIFIGWDLRTGFSWNITSWASSTDPSPGAYTLSIQLSGVPQLVITQDHEIIYWRGGPWVGNGFTGLPQVPTYNTVTMTFVTTREKVGYNSISIRNEKLRMVLNPNGTAEPLFWVDNPGQWSLFWKFPMDDCDLFSPCGPFSICNANEVPHCSCLRGFRPKNPSRWPLKDVSDGCVRNTTLDCRNGTGTDGFVPVNGVKLPDTSAAVADGGLGLDECRIRCLTNCSCTAYSLANVTNGRSGCIVWTGELKDMRLYANGGQELYVRVAVSDLGTLSSQSDHKSKKIAIIVVPIMGSLLIGSILISCLIAHHKNRKKIIRMSHMGNDEVASDKAIDLPLFDFESIAEATNNFSDDNKLGEGGFGPVYKGKKKDGKEIAVKRLSKSSQQGINEFKNEVMLIAQLQHRNLILLLGCCIQRQERMLIYEYMPNKSLDTFLFDKEKKVLLNWKMRYSIIIGITRGLLYLHQDSMVRVIHRDLKASNILLNQEMVPKISDFGLARIFGEYDVKTKTERVVGTYGYMSPEYIIEGIFSTKSDVFSFGVIVLEIISSKRNRGLSPSQSNNHLIELAWSLWNEGKALELVDESINNSVSIDEVLRCIKVGLLCVQEQPNDRPLMSLVILMLTSDKEVLPEPKLPGFITRKHSSKVDHSSLIKQESDSINEVSLTMPHGR